MDVVKLIKEIRKDRVALVQHVEQYRFILSACELYAQFVEADLSSDAAACGAPVTYDKAGTTCFLGVLGVA